MFKSLLSNFFRGGGNFVIANAIINKLLMHKVISAILPTLIAVLMTIILRTIKNLVTHNRNQKKSTFNLKTFTIFSILTCIIAMIVTTIYPIVLQIGSDEHVIIFIHTWYMAVTSAVITILLMIGWIIKNLCYTIKIFKNALSINDTKILRPAKLGFWLTIAGTISTIIFVIPFMIPIALGLLILGHIFTKQANNMMDTDAQTVNNNVYSQTDALEKLRMRQGQG